MVSIKYPIWKTKSVGIAEHKIGTFSTDIEITYEDHFGNRVFPHIYTIKTDKIRKYPVQVVNEHLRLRIVPIADLEIKSEAVLSPAAKAMTRTGGKTDDGLENIKSWKRDPGPRLSLAEIAEQNPIIKKQMEDLGIKPRTK